MKIHKNYKEGLQYWTMLYFACMFLAFPLYFQNNYINILEAKTLFFKLATYIYLVGSGAVLWLISIIRVEEDRKLKIKQKTKKAKKSYKMQNQDIWVCAFGVAVLLATILSGNFKNAWYSPDGKLFGTEIILLCCGLYFVVKKGIVKSKVTDWAIGIGCGLVFALTILNRYGIDPLHMYSNLVAEQKSLYVSTIGNINIVSAYICVFIPVFCGAFLIGRRCGLLYCLALMAGVSTNSDSFFLGCGCAMILFLWVAMENHEKMLRYIWICILSAGSVLGLKWMNHLINYNCKWKIIQIYLLEKINWYFILVVLLVVLLIIRKYGEQLPWKQIRKGVFALIACVTMVFVIYVIWLNLGNANAGNSMLIFGDSWGTNRGYVWKRTVSLFKELPLYQKLFGVGPGGFKEFFAVYNAERVKGSLLPFVDPHNEILFYLSSTGLIGAITYIGMFVSMIRKCLMKRDEKTMILLAVFVAWIAQGMVNTPLVFTTPFLFMFFGCVVADENK